MLKKQIIKESKKIGIDGIGFTDAEVNLLLKKKLKKQAHLGYNCSFQKGTIEERVNPKLLMSDAKTIIVIFLAYPKTDYKLETLAKNEVYFASCSWGCDYHIVIKRKLNLLAEFIKKRSPSFKYKIVCDSSPLCDRTLAYQAGLGFFGNNNLLINEQYGSYIFIGALVTNLKLDKDKSLTKKCHNCNRCINACPTNALNKEGLLNSHRCLSYLTQKQTSLTQEEISLMNNCIYGCDICLQVCPYNKKNNNHRAEFLPTGIEFINVEQFKPLSNREFKRKYGSLAGSWCGNKVINRNINFYRQKIRKKEHKLNT